jgi:biopolymer transport protein ExbD/biopolymer transport protein TolR
MRVHKPIIVRPQSEPKSAINVTPLVDVVLVLLIIFMVVMPLLERHLAVRIPAEEQVEVQDTPPPDQIVVSVEKSGGFTINGQPVEPSAYVSALKERLDARAPNDRTVFVTPDDDAQYKKLVEAFDGARKAGAVTLGMPTENGAR